MDGNTERRLARALGWNPDISGYERIFASILQVNQSVTRAHSSEMAASVLVDAVYNAWYNGATASLLQQDLQSAFDIDHGLPVYILQQLDLPEWLWQWTTHYL